LLRRSGLQQLLPFAQTLMAQRYYSVVREILMAPTGATGQTNFE
jgi:hypothetical protein